MFKPGDIVIQDKTMVVNNINFKDNKKNRLCVVLFSYINENGDLYYCTAPITNSTRGTYKSMISKNKLYVPKLLLSNTKLCCIKYDCLYLYDKSNEYSTGLKIDNNILMRLYERIIDFKEEDNQKKLYAFIRTKIKDNIIAMQNTKKDIKKLKRKK